MYVLGVAMWAVLWFGLFYGCLVFALIIQTAVRQAQRVSPQVVKRCTRRAVHRFILWSDRLSTGAIAVTVAGLLAACEAPPVQPIQSSGVGLGARSCSDPDWLFLCERRSRGWGPL